MHRSQRFVSALTVLGVCASLAFANVPAVAPSQNSGLSTPSWLSSLLSMPVFHFFAPLFERDPEPPVAPSSAPVFASQLAPAASCSVAPLDRVEDPSAQQLESVVGSAAVVDLSGLTPGAAKALGRFEKEVSAAGGTIVLKSAYRPAAYQQHLLNVWHKWMDELKDNEEPVCQDLRAKVEDEFQRHHLLETQHPVPVSDHTRGLAFDARVELPPHAKLGRRRVTLDILANLVKLRRPALVNDPVHFKFIG